MVGRKNFFALDSAFLKIDSTIFQTFWKFFYSPINPSSQSIILLIGSYFNKVVSKCPNIRTYRHIIIINNNKHLLSYISSIIKASNARPPDKAPSPIILTTLKSSFSKFLLTAIPKAAEIDVDA